MQKLLEVLIDKDGSIHFNSEVKIGIKGEPTMKDLRRFDKLGKEAIKSLIKCLWGEHDYDIYPIIRILSMAEMLSCLDPAAQVEEFWHMMTFDYIPHLTDFADSIKKRYGYIPDPARRVFTFANPDFFPKGSLPFRESDPELCRMDEYFSRIMKGDYSGMSPEEVKELEDLKAAVMEVDLEDEPTVSDAGKSPDYHYS